MADRNTFHLMKSLPLKAMHLYFVLSTLIFAMVQTFKYFEVPSPEWVFSYLNDLLVIPLVLTVCLHGAWFLKRDRNIRLNIFTIFSVVTLYSLYFEVYLPTLSDSYTGDIYDVVCYLAGGIIFYFLQNPTLILKEPRTP